MLLFCYFNLFKINFVKSSDSWRFVSWGMFLISRGGCESGGFVCCNTLFCVTFLTDDQDSVLEHELVPPHHEGALFHLFIDSEV